MPRWLTRRRRNRSDAAPGSRDMGHPDSPELGVVGRLGYGKRLRAHEAVDRLLADGVTVVTPDSMPPHRPVPLVGFDQHGNPEIDPLGKPLDPEVRALIGKAREDAGIEAKPSLFVSGAEPPRPGLSNLLGPPPAPRNAAERDVKDIGL